MKFLNLLKLKRICHSTIAISKSYGFLFMEYLDPTIEFEPVKIKGEVVFARVYITSPEKDMHHHYYSVIAMEFVDMVSELAKILGFAVVVLDDDVVNK